MEMQLGHGGAQSPEIAETRATPGKPEYDQLPDRLDGGSRLTRAYAWRWSSPFQDGIVSSLLP